MVLKSDITVIVPIYNVENYVSKCLKSLLEQTYKNFVIWAVDDGSSDDSPKIIKKYANIDSRVKIIQKSNGGYGSVLEYCIKRITTKYFLVLDPDDWLKKTALSELHSFAITEDLDLVVGDRYNVYVDNYEKKYVKSCTNNLTIKSKVVYNSQNRIQEFSFFLVSPHAKLFKTEISKNIRIPHGVSYTDFVLYVLSLSNAKRVMYYDRALAYYLIDRPGNTTTTKKLSAIDDYLIGWNSVFDQLHKDKGTGVLLSRLYTQLKFIMYEYSKVLKEDVNKGYKRKILVAIKSLQSYRKYVSKKDIGSKLLYYGLMNKFMYKTFAELYIKLKS